MMLSVGLSGEMNPLDGDQVRASGGNDITSEPKAHGALQPFCYPLGWCEKRAVRFFYAVKQGLQTDLSVLQIVNNTGVLYCL